MIIYSAKPGNQKYSFKPQSRTVRMDVAAQIEYALREMNSNAVEDDTIQRAINNYEAGWHRPILLDEVVRCKKGGGC